MYGFPAPALTVEYAILFSRELLLTGQNLFWPIKTLSTDWKYL
jgi:hypothetical protein